MPHTALHEQVRTYAKSLNADSFADIQRSLAQILRCDMGQPKSTAGLTVDFMITSNRIYIESDPTKLHADIMIT